VTSAAILAVDGGNSKTDVALVGADGVVLGAVRGPGASHHRLGVEAAAEVLEELVEAACRDAGTPPAARPLAEVGVWCLAGLDLPADDQAVQPALAARRWAREDLLHNDVFAVMRAGSERTWGIGVVVGSGMNCAGVGPDGTEVRFPALGELSGDWGGGRDIGVAAVGAALRGEDGRGRRTALERLVPRHFGLSSVLAVVEAIHLGRVAGDRVVELAPLVFTAAEAGDDVATELVARQADEVVTMAGTAIRRLGLTGADVDVALGGGVLRRDDPPFLERIRAGIARVAAAARVRQATGPPVVGAALLGLDRLGSPSAAAERLRATLTDDRLRPRRRATASPRSRKSTHHQTHGIPRRSGRPSR
jgi:N-acetylglucosamine kinase-like BadF-type ATPase